MKTIPKSDTLVEIIAEQQGTVLHRVSTDKYLEGRKTTAPKADAADYDERIKPPYTKGQYDAKVASLIREKYTADEEAALKSKLLAAILHPDAAVINDDGQPKAVSQFDAFLAYREECLHRAKDPALYSVAELPE